MFEELADYPIAPVHLVDLEVKCFYRSSEAKGKMGEKFLLPSTSHLCDEAPFALVLASWSEKGLFFLVESYLPMQESCYPSVDQGDAVEIFINTRNLKSTGYPTRFSHHFFFLPQAASTDHRCGEITKFRTDDQHDLCDPEDLTVQTTKTREGYEMLIKIPSKCMTGFDPSELDRIGFTYRISAAGGRKQHFSGLSRSFPVEQRPSLWSEVKFSF